MNGICTRNFEINCIFDQINCVITPIRTLSVALNKSFWQEQVKHFLCQEQVKQFFFLL